MSVRTPTCDVPKGDAGHLLRHLIMALRVHAGENLRPLGFTLPQFGVMMALHLNPGRSNAELARGAFITPQAMGEVLTALEKAKLVRRKPQKGNARILLAELTPAGTKALTACKKAMQGVQGRMFSRLSEENKQQLAALLELCLIGLNSPP